MLLNHIRFSTRVFLKDKFFSILNILGLALGIAVGIVLLLILQHDLSYDRYHVNHQNIYRLGGHLTATGVEFRGARSARELASILQEELPEVQAVVRAESWDRVMVKHEGKDQQAKAFYEENIVRTDSTFFRIFTHEFLSGDPMTCLNGEHHAVITLSIAKKYFGDVDPVGEMLQIDGRDWDVTAVIADVPENTHLKFDLLLSGLGERSWVIENGQPKSEAFWNPDVYTYLLMPAQYDTSAFYSKFDGIYAKFYKPFGDQVGGNYVPILEPLASIHFYSQLEGDEPHGNLTYLYAFAGIGVFIILLACINYMNLSTAKSVRRAGEIAMKKTLGSDKRTLVLAFLGESVLLSFVSLLLAIILVLVVLKATSFNQLIEKNLSLDFFNNPLLLTGSLGIALTMGIISGLYPAFYLPAIPTIKALKGAYKNRKSAHVLRRVLITVQFAISIFVVLCTLFMQDQVDYVRNRELGFDQDNVLIMPIQDTLVQKQIGTIKSDFITNPRITGATTAYNVMGFNVGGGSVMWAEGESGMQQQSFSLMFVGEDYLKTMNIPVIKGRDFLAGPNADVQDVFIANEAAAELMGWGEDAVGKRVKFFHAKTDGHVIGVVKDFNFTSLHNPIEPLLIIKASEEGGFLHLKVSGDHLPQTISDIQEKWQK
ncbi:MAG TPA: ABC transporter permease, partial [Ohtaekwangia sp.]|nr:ABC transporter permease [Ohtaekwangia sp.]